MHMRFVRITEKDLPLLAEWLNRPHVAEWWGGGATLAGTRAELLPQTVHAPTVVPYLAYSDEIPLGYIQSYVAVESEDGWWAGRHDPGVRGIDQFLADLARLGQGLGTQMVRAFSQLLFADPLVTRIQADPSPNNRRAIRCYEKAGFRRAGQIKTPDGSAVLMLLDRPQLAPTAAR